MSKNEHSMTHENELTTEAISRGLDTRLIARRVFYLEQVTSTNNLARQHAEAGEPEGTLVIADEQTAGRGRLGRSWIAPARSSILLSLILRPTLEPSQIARVTMAVSLATCDGIRYATGLEAQIKWPNDILLNGHKCGGILAETSTTGERVEYVIAGLGLDVNFAAAKVDGIPADATTLSDETGREVPRLPLTQAILRATEHYYLRIQSGEDLHKEWLARLVTLNQHVRAQTPGGTEEGLAEGVDPEGALLLRRIDGSLVRLMAGDVTLSPRAL
jgi:BirA family transcriptional regulator, biotin operon repressor / biotin---[acetyl-CoA-carboxylase] ligase